MKRNLLIAVAVTVAVAAAAVIATATGCGTSGFAQRTASPDMSAPAAHGQSACTDLGGTVGTDRTCHIQSGTPAYKIDISFPLDYPDLQAVTTFLNRHRDDFTDWVDKFGPDGRGRPYEYVVTAKTFRSGPPDSGTESLVLHIGNDTGLANQGHPNTTFAAFNFDLGKHAPITFETLFRPGTTPLDVLNPIVQRELGTPAAELDETKYQNFAITDDAVIFFFDQNQVVQDNGGPRKVAVPRTELASLLR